MKFNLKSLVLATALSFGSIGQSSALSLFPAEPIGSLDYNFVQGTYSYIDSDFGTGNGFNVASSFLLGDSDFFFRANVGYFQQEVEYTLTSYRFSGNRIRTSSRTVTETFDTTTFDFGGGYRLPIADYFHIVGEVGAGVIVTDADNIGYVRAALYGRLLTFGFLELNGGGVMVSTENDTFLNPTYGINVNISKTFRLIARVELEDQFDRYEIGARFSW